MRATPFATVFEFVQNGKLDLHPKATNHSGELDMELLREILDIAEYLRLDSYFYSALLDQLSFESFVELLKILNERPEIQATLSWSNSSILYQKALNHSFDDFSQSFESLREFPSSETALANWFADNFVQTRPSKFYKQPKTFEKAALSYDVLGQEDMIFHWISFSNLNHCLKQVRVKLPLKQNRINMKQNTRLI